MFRARLFLDTSSERELMPAVLQWNYGKAMAAIPIHSSHFLTPPWESPAINTPQVVVNRTPRHKCLAMLSLDKAGY